MPLRAVIFDFGNTLAVPEDSAAFTRECLAEMGIEPEADRFARAMREEERFGRIADTPLETDWRACREFYQARSVRLLKMLGVGGHVDAKALWLMELYEAKSLRRTPHAGCPEILIELSRAGLRLAVLSNSDGRVAARCAAMGVADHFERIVDSALVGLAKPNPEVFARTLREMGLEPGEAVSVGDSWRNDVWCPMQLGMRAVLVNAATIRVDDFSPKPEAHVANLQAAAIQILSMQ